MKILKAQEILKNNCYDEMSIEELKIVEDYEIEIYKPRMDKLKRNDEEKSNWVHNLWLDYCISNETEDKLLSYLNY